MLFPKRRFLLAPRPHLRAGALASGSLLSALLLPASSLYAGAHAAHPAHHAGVSAGKVAAHAVHDDEPKISHRAGAPAANGKVSSPAKNSRTGSHARHANDEQSSSKPASKARSSHKHHTAPPPDDPPPVFRARGTRDAREPEVENATLPHRRAVPAHASIPEETASQKPTTRPARSVAALPAGESARTGTSLSESDFQRGSRSSTLPAMANTSASGSAPVAAAVHPESERPAMHAVPEAANTPATRTPRPAPVAQVKAPEIGTAIVVAAPDVPLPSRPREAVEGLGGEVDYTAPVTAGPRAPAVPMPRESPAEQERDLREAADVAAKPLYIPLYDRDGKLLVPPPLKGSHDILVHQNQMADDAGLARIQDDDDLDRMRRAKLLTDFNETASLHINDSLPMNRRSARPWTVRFGNDVARAFYARFGVPLQLNSAVRTVAYQLRLQRVNGNAAAVEGDSASPHLTGQAIDFGKRGMSLAQIAWMRSYLMPLMDAGKIDVEEEFQQACFHISVYSSYVPTPKPPPVRTEFAQVGKPAHSHTSTGSAAPDGDLR